MYPNLIIGGTNKAGTTSLFRYLSDHPSVCASRVKEVRHFTGQRDPLSREALAQYALQFNACQSQPVRLEASPDYLAGGETVAGQIHTLLPDAKLIFVLREPVSRLISDFQRRQSRNDPSLQALDLSGYLQAVMNASEMDPDSDFTRDRLAVTYAPLLQSYLGYFSASQIALRFFDDLQANTPRFLEDLCQFIGIDPCFYDKYDFRIENRTRPVRSRGLHKLVHSVNMFSEPMLNKLPTIRRALRTVYNQVNEAKTESRTPDAADYPEILELMAPDLKQLTNLIHTHYPQLRLPPWLAGAK